MKFTLTIAILCGLMAFSAFAQTAKVLTLDGAVQIALDKNITVIQSRNSVDQAQSTSRAAFGSFLPDLNFSGGFNRQQSWKSTGSGTTYYNGIPIQTGGASYGALNQYNTGLNSQVTLFNGFATNYRYNSSQASTDAAIHGYDRTKQSTIIQTHQLYLNVVRTFELMKVSDENLKRDQQQLDRITESNKVGSVAIADVYRQKVQTGSDELALIQAQNNYEKAKADCLAFLGVELDTAYQFDFTGIPTDIDTTQFAPLNAQYADFNGLVTGALDKRPDYLSSIAQLNSTESNVSVAKSGYFPVISGQANYGFNNDQLSTLKDNRSLYLGLNVSLPIFNGFSTQNQIEQAEVLKENAEELVNQSHRTVTVDIRKALLDLEAAEKEVYVTQSSIISAHMDQQIAQEKYNLGAGTLLDLLTASANLSSAESNKVNAVNDFLLAKKNLEFVTGTIAH